MENIQDLLFKFREHQKILNRSPATIKSYTEHVNLFLCGVDADDIRQVSARMIEDYIAGLYDWRSLTGKPYKTNTICIKIRAVKRFFEYLEEANIIFINPSEFITEPKKDKGIIKDVLTPEEARTIIDQPNLGTLSGIRDRAILEMLYSTGIRRNELCSLSVYDADLQSGMVRVKGKGSRQRIVPIGKHAAKFLREYIHKVRPRFTKNNRTSRYLFVNCSGNPVSGQIISLMVRKYTASAKIKKKITPHTFRNSFATSLVKNGANVVAVQRMLGHRDLSTTQVYIRSLGIDIKKVHQKTHPRERDKEKARLSKPKIERIKGKYERK